MQLLFMREREYRFNNNDRKRRYVKMMEKVTGNQNMLIENAIFKFVICKSWQHADMCDMKSGHICKATKVYMVITADSSAVMSMRGPRTVALSAQSLAEYCLHLDHHYRRPHWHHHLHHHRHCHHRHEQLTVTPSGRKRSRFAWGMMKQSLPVEDFR